jgi:hypothetical protein
MKSFSYKGAKTREISFPLGGIGSIELVKRFLKALTLFLFVMLPVVFVGAESWTYENPFVWTRDTGAGEFSVDDDVYTVTHTGEHDWSFSGFKRIEVQTGEIFEINANIKITSDSHYSDAQTCVILRHGEEDVISWAYGGTTLKGSNDWTKLTSSFIVPRGVNTIEPRIIGHNKSVVEIKDFIVERKGKIQMFENTPEIEEITFGRGDLKIRLDGNTGGFSVEDKRTGRVWSPAIDDGWIVLDMKASGSKANPSATVRLLNPESTLEISAVFSQQDDIPEVLVEISGEGELKKTIDYPTRFGTKSGDRMIMPVNEGLGLAVDEHHEHLWRWHTYGGHGLCMSFFGVVEDSTGAGWMCILETPDDAAIMFRKTEESGLWSAGPSWEASFGKFSYKRKIRYIFFDKGGHVGLCKRYRKYSKEIGLFKPFTEKVKQNPNIDKLIGAANIWNFDAGKQKLNLVAEMQSLGMDRLLWSGGGSADEIKALNSMTNVLTGRYDIYQDIMDPQHFDKVRYVHHDWVTEAFPDDINWAGKDGYWRRGWPVETKGDDTERIPCAVICDSKAVKYARKRISEELKEKPYTARFIDTTVAAPWFECYHPDHPMTRSESKHHKMELLRLVSEEFNLVCGSETGHEASVPFCDYFEGMLSLGPYRISEAGRAMTRVIDEVPPQIYDYQVNPARRLPLWELVYHDCVVAHWYWGDYNNKLPKVWRLRDLFNVLYGTPPMYMTGIKQWEEMKYGFAASYKVAQPVSRATGYHEMVDHRHLTKDRKVQQTLFANGVSVIVNFGDTTFTTADGVEIKPLDFIISGLDK